MLINRKQELELLNKIYKQERAELMLLYGRRRVGKTRLLQEFIKDKNAHYFIVDISADILKTFERTIKEKFIRFSNWDDFFDFIKLEGKKRTVLVLDEFQYLYKVEKAWPTILQRRWEDLKNTKIMIILCGSIISTIYRIAMGYGSALYGRKTYEIEITPLNFFDAKNFMPQYSTEDFIYVYTIVGGIPRYLEEFDDTKNIWENIKDHILHKNCFLYREPLNLFYEEFKNPSTYLTIIHALSEGKKKFNKIATQTNIPTGKLSKYLNVLERVKIIQKIVPITEKKERIRNTQYTLSDNFIKFWFEFVYPARSLIELDDISPVIKKIKTDLNNFIGQLFEEVSKQFLIYKKPIVFTHIGTWWHKDKEIDIVALNENKKEITFFECKWKNLSYNQSIEILEKLKEKAKFVNWYKKGRKEQYGLIAKKIEDKENLRKKGFLVYDLDDWD
ncbi:MAG: ATP-binding protein [Candidatus Thermoplasmatota archaeon]|jgi:AAA+ ATPase superfamily predicted ATPase|nr:ATP-binding protein [Candidatus Thermoplasmatota archaeon]